ncbi:N-acetylglucosamine-specific PTS transporter subunit IIBC [Microbacterium aoyamense]|uniref:N-acetylglucosamine-specific PTS transporter subunit IIBC n=1 Tax=Microbacterium aoyamense TaxID=344166 RepID=A0ABP5AZQ8_9MICO|nr:N-acetylglucosamine-specific PTS transporter subunit IIBC [Microbacterium aoyamense]
MKFMQRLGRSFMLPVAVLPVAAILVGLSNWAIGIFGPNVVSTFISAAGIAMLDNMALLFAVGISLGMANKTDGTSALAGLVSWLTVQAILAPVTVSVLYGIDVESVDPAFGRVNNVFVGIVCGLIGAWSYNKFKDTKLPDALSFFSGRRSVALVAAGVSLVFAAILLFLWPFVFGGLVIFGEWIVTLGPVGAGIYGFLNRALIPLGLHHALNSVFWFDVAGINDLNNFLAGSSGDGVYGVTGQYMTGFFPIMMFGLPGAALAMYVTAKTTRKKVVAGLLLSAAISSFFVGVTEPLEFSFMFLAPWLYLTHAVFTGISLAIASILPVRMGFGFSAGFTDLILQWTNPLAQNPWIILVMGVFWFFVYFFVFRFFIRRFNLKTPGREDDDVVEEVGDAAVGEDKFALAGAKFIRALGGKDNIIELDNCATRLRMEIADTSKVDDAALKRAGASGTIKPGGHSVQVIYGLNVQFVKDAMEQIIEGKLDVPEAIEAFPGATAAETGFAAGVATAVGVPNVAAATIAAGAAASSKADAAGPVIRLLQPIEGAVVPLAGVPDPMFAQGVMGPGAAIDPSGDTVVAPADATVASVFPTGHAIGLELDGGVELLIHVGVDTVNMKGDGFEVLVEAGQKVSRGTPLLRFDRAKIEAAGLSAITPVIVLNDETASVAFD